MRVTDPVVNQFLEPDHEFDFNPVNRNLCFGGGGGVFKPIVKTVEDISKGVTSSLDPKSWQKVGEAQKKSLADYQKSVNPWAGVDFSNLKLDIPKPPPTPVVKPPVVKPPEVNLPEVKPPTPPPVPSPNLDQDLTKGSTGAIQEAAIKAGSDVQTAATKAGSDVQAAAIKAGSDVQAGVSEIVNQTGVKNETLEKIIESNVSGTEASIETAVSGAEAEIEKNVQGTENQIEDITKGIEEIGTILTQPFQKETESTDEPADTTVSPVEDTSSNPPPGPGEVLTDEMTAQERKSRNRLLQAGRYGRQRTILTGGSGISGYGY